MVLRSRVDRKDAVAHIFSHDPPVSISQLNLHLAPVFGLLQLRQRPGMAFRITRLAPDQLPGFPTVFREVQGNLCHRCPRLMCSPRDAPHISETKKGQIFGPDPYRTNRLASN